MSRYIDADALLEFCDNAKSKTIDCNDIARFPSIDIVFCKDCKYWYESTCRDGCDRGLCHIGVTLEDDYCSYGEQRENQDG